MHSCIICKQSKLPKQVIYGSYRASTSRNTMQNTKQNNYDINQSARWKLYIVTNTNESISPATYYKHHTTPHQTTQENRIQRANTDKCVPRACTNLAFLQRTSTHIHM